MDVSEDTNEKVNHFAQKRQKAEEFYDEQPTSPDAFELYNRKLDDTLKELQDQVKRHEDELRKVCKEYGIQILRARLTLAIASHVEFNRFFRDRDRSLGPCFSSS